MAILNIYALITKTPTFINETLLHVNYILSLITVIVNDFSINRQVIQWRKIREIVESNNIINQMGLIYLESTPSKHKRKYLLLSTSQNFLQTWHKASLNRNKKIEIRPCTLVCPSWTKVWYPTTEKNRKLTNS